MHKVYESQKVISTHKLHKWELVSYLMVSEHCQIHK